MVLNVHENHKAYQGRGERGEGWGEGVMEVGEEGHSLHCHHQNDSYIKIGSRFNI